MTVSPEDAWSAVGASDALAIGDKQEFSLPDGRLVLVLRTAEGLFACNADCPHQDTPLAEGTVDDGVLTCPLHFWQWDIRTGEPIGLAELPLPIFDVRDEGGELQVRPRPRPDQG